MTSRAATDLPRQASFQSVLDVLVEAVAERVAKKLARPPDAVTVYTTNKKGPHIPGKSRRWMLDRIKLMPGARKVGRDWAIAAAAYEIWASIEDARHVREAKPTRRPVPVTPERLDDDEAARRVERSLKAAGYRRST